MKRQVWVTRIIIMILLLALTVTLSIFSCKTIKIAWGLNNINSSIQAYNEEIASYRSIPNKPKQVIQVMLELQEKIDNLSQKRQKDFYQSHDAWTKTYSNWPYRLKLIVAMLSVAILIFITIFWSIFVKRILKIKPKKCNRKR